MPAFSALSRAKNDQSGFPVLLKLSIYSASLPIHGGWHLANRRYRNTLSGHGGTRSTLHQPPQAAHVRTEARNTSVGHSRPARRELGPAMCNDGSNCLRRSAVLSRVDVSRQARHPLPH
jgi:hypothetical protein